MLLRMCIELHAFCNMFVQARALPALCGIKLHAHFYLTWTGLPLSSIRALTNVFVSTRLQTNPSSTWAGITW